MVIGYRSSFMQRVQEAAANGYVHVVTGMVDVRKYENLYRKFNALYDIDMHKSKRSREKAKGRALVRLFAHPEDGDLIRWVLMATEGDGLFFEHERKEIFSAAKLELFGQYRLNRKTRKGVDHPVWTFSLLPDYHQELMSKAHQFIHFKNDVALRKLIHDSSRLVPFNGVRQDLYVLHKHIREDWRRHRGNGMPELPFIHWQRRLATELVDVNAVIRRMERTDENACEAVRNIVNNRR